MFGELLRSARVELGLTQAELARLARTSQPSVSDYESGRVSPTVDVAQRLLAVMGKNLATVPEWTAADRRSLELARVYVRRLVEEPEAVRAVARQNLARMRRMSPHVRPWVDAWEGVLELPVHVIADLLLDDGEFARAMRSTNPFAGVVSERDRRAVLQAESSRA